MAKNLFNDAYQDFDVAFLGINDYGKRKYDPSKWFIYPVSEGDLLGTKRIESVLNDFKPDLIFLFQDIYHIANILPHIKKEHPTIPIVTYFPVDGEPFNVTWQLPFAEGMVNLHLTYSQFALDAIYARFPQLRDRKDYIKILNHGVNGEVFYPLIKANRKEYRASLKWTDKFVAINVNRFQPRKLIALTLRIFSLLTHGYKKCKCGNYYLASKSKCDLNWCGPDKVMEIVPPNEDIGLYLHMNQIERTMGPPHANTLQVHALNAGYVDTDLNKNIFMLENRNVYNDPLTEEELCHLYNAADLNVTTTFGEGWGLSLSEAAACGTRSIAPFNSAIPEVLAGTDSKLVKNQALMNIALDSAHLRPIVSVPRFVDAVTMEYKEWLANGRRKLIDEKGAALMKEKFQWKDKAEWLMSEFKKLLPSFFPPAEI